MATERPNMANANKRIAKNSIFLSIRMVFVLGITLYTTRAILQILGVEDYGVYNVVCGFVSMFAFLNTSMANGIQRFYNYEFGKNGAAGANRVYCTALLIQLILAVVVVVLTESFGLWYLHHKMVIPEERMLAAEWIFQFSVLSFLFVIMQAPYTAAVMAHERMDFYAVVSVFDAVLKLAIVFAVPYLSGDRLVGYGLLLALISVLNFALYYWYCKKNFAEITFHRLHGKALFRSMLGFSGWNMFGSFGGVMRDQGVNLIMNLFFGPIVNAAKGIATQINAGIQSFVQNITIPVRPQVIQSYAQRNIERAFNLTYSISKLSCYLLTLMALPVCLEMDSILKVWLGSHIPEHTKFFAIITILCSYQGNLNSAISTIAHATGDIKKYQVWGTAVKLLSLPLGYILLLLGMFPEAALIAILLCDMLGHFTCLFVIRSMINFSIGRYIRKVAFPVIVVACGAFLFTLPFHICIEGQLIRFTMVLIASCFSVSILALTFGTDKGEKVIMQQLLRVVASKIKRNKVNEQNI